MMEFLFYYCIVCYDYDLKLCISQKKILANALFITGSKYGQLSIFSWQFFAKIDAYYYQKNPLVQEYRVTYIFFKSMSSISYKRCE